MRDLQCDAILLISVPNFVNKLQLSCSLYEDNARMKLVGPKSRRFRYLLLLQSWFVLMCYFCFYNCTHSKRTDPSNSHKAATTFRGISLVSEPVLTFFCFVSLQQIFCLVSYYHVLKFRSSRKQSYPQLLRDNSQRIELFFSHGR